MSKMGELWLDESYTWPSVSEVADGQFEPAE